LSRKTLTCEDVMHRTLPGSSTWRCGVGTVFAHREPSR